MSSLFFPVHGLVAGRSRRKTPTPGASSAAESRVLYQNRPTIATTNCKSAHVFRFFAAFSPKLKLASQPAPLGKRHHLGIAHHHMIQHPHPHQIQRFLHTFGNTAVSVAGLSDTSG